MAFLYEKMQKNKYKIKITSLAMQSEMETKRI